MTAHFPFSVAASLHVITVIIIIIINQTFIMRLLLSKIKT